MKESVARERLEEAFDALPVRDELCFLIPHEVDWLIRFAEALAKKPHNIRDDGWNRKAQQATERFSKLALALHKSAQSMPPSAVGTIARQMGSSAPAALLPLDLAVRGAFRILGEESGKAAKKDAAKSKGGRPQKRETENAQRVAQWAADSYTLLTGKAATPGSDRITDERSEFERFLGNVYDALGINASAEVQARARRGREKTSQK